jgi:hypothetical protein
VIALVMSRDGITQPRSSFLHLFARLGARGHLAKITDGDSRQ